MMFMIWMFCFAENNKIISAMENIITESECKKKDFEHTSGSQGL
jgi:hypothetical protein